MNVIQRAPLTFLHHHTDRLLVAFKILLHGLEHPGLCSHAVQGAAQRLELFAKLLCPLGTGSLPQSVACDSII